MKRHKLLEVKPHYNTSLSFSILTIASGIVCSANMRIFGPIFGIPPKAKSSRMRSFVPPNLLAIEHLRLRQPCQAIRGHGKRRIGSVFVGCAEEAKEFAGPRCPASVGFLPPDRSTQRLIRWRKTRAVVEGEAYWRPFAGAFHRSKDFTFPSNESIPSRYPSTESEQIDKFPAPSNPRSQHLPIKWHSIAGMIPTR